MILPETDAGFAGPVPGHRSCRGGRTVQFSWPSPSSGARPGATRIRGHVKPASITFPNRDYTGFAEEVKAKVAEYFDTRGLSRNATPAMVAKTVLLVALTFVPYGLILSNTSARWTMLGLAVLMGVGVAGIGFSVAHDALHGAYSDNPGSTGWSAGRSTSRRQRLHVEGHPQRDPPHLHQHRGARRGPDRLAAAPALARAPWKPFHRFQHLYGFAGVQLLHPLLGLRQGLQVLPPEGHRALTRTGSIRRTKSPICSSARLVYYSWAIVIPLLVLDIPWWQFVIGFLVMNLIAGHDPRRGLPAGARRRGHHTRRQTRRAMGCMDGARDGDHGRLRPETGCSAGMSGGLNFQMEHHLFPKVCSIHYPAISTS